MEFLTIKCLLVIVEGVVGEHLVEDSGRTGQKTLVPRERLRTTIVEEFRQHSEREL